ncbi:MAG: class I SAM-dependent methyltransferase [Chloroflexi bacterium]|nr:class I SAM-dependent methyltransferase [Chloroflexota bacterium]
MANPIVATKETIEEIFDGAAERYDREGPSVFRKFGGQLVELMHLAGGERVLDVATGKGAVLIPAAEIVGRYGRVVGIDLSSKMLDETESIAREAGLDNFELYKMDAEHLEFRDEIFDMVTCAFALFFFPSMKVALKEMYRVLVPGGRLGVTVFGSEPPPFDPGWRIFAEQARAYDTAVRTPQRVVYSPDDVKSVLEEAGFVEVETQLKVYDVVYRSEADWWAFQMTLGNRASILRMPEETRRKFKEEHLARMRPLFREDGLHVGVSVVYGTARKSNE